MAIGIAAVSLGCGGSDDNGTNSNGASSRKYSVRYEVSGTFTQQCNIFYITRKSGVNPDQQNEGGDPRQEITNLPWTYTFEVTVTPLRPFVTQVSAVCSESTAQTAEVAIFIDGVEVDRDQETDTVVGPLAEYTLQLNQ